MPEIGSLARTGFNPVGRRDRLGALGAGISVRQIVEVRSGHNVFLFPLLLFLFSEKHVSVFVRPKYIVEFISSPIKCRWMFDDVIC